MSDECLAEARTVDSLHRGYLPLLEDSLFPSRVLFSDSKRSVFRHFPPILNVHGDGMGKLAGISTCGCMDQYHSLVDLHF